MRILYLNHNLMWRGTFFRCMGYARELVKQGHRVDLWTVSREPNRWGTLSVIDGVYVWQTPRWGSVGKHDGGYAPLDIFSRMLHAKDDHWDIIHAFDHRPNVLLPWQGMKICNRLFSKRERPLFFSDWCDWWTAGGITTSRRRFQWMDRIEQRIEEGSKRQSDGVTVIGETLYQRALDVGVNPDKLLLLPAGIDPGSFPMLNQTKCRDHLNLPNDGPLFGFVGFSLWDLQLLADAFFIIKRQRPDAMLLIVGGGVEEESKSIFQERFTIGRDVFMPGVVPFEEVPSCLGACDIQLMPMDDTLANRARVPNKLCDYFASGRPVVVSNVGDAATIVRKYQVGVIAEHGAKSFADACLNLLNAPDAIIRYSKNARITAEEHFSYATQTELLCGFYEQRFAALHRTR